MSAHQTSHRELLAYLARRLVLAGLLVFLASSAAFLLVDAAPGDPFDGFDMDPATAAAERHRLGLDRPFAIRYGAWLGRAARLDLGDSVKYGRPVSDLVAERAPRTALLGVTALALATMLGIPAGILTGSRRNALTAGARAVSLALVSVPPLVSSFALLLLAARTRWFPVGGFPSSSDASAAAMLPYLVLPAFALALPLAGSLERLQSQAISEALAHPSVAAAAARGCSRGRLVWRHALRLSLVPVIAIYGVIIGSALSGSFAVEVVTSWPGLGSLMYDALVARDLYLVAGCAAAGAVFLALGILAADLVMAFADPRLEAGA